jgi:hypothetical protein
MRTKDRSSESTSSVIGYSTSYSSWLHVAFQPCSAPNSGPTKIVHLRQISSEPLPFGVLSSSISRFTFPSSGRKSLLYDLPCDIVKYAISATIVSFSPFIAVKNVKDGCMRANEVYKQRVREANMPRPHVASLLVPHTLRTDICSMTSLQSAFPETLTISPSLSASDAAMTDATAASSTGNENALSILDSVSASGNPTTTSSQEGGLVNGGAVTPTPTSPRYEINTCGFDPLGTPPASDCQPWLRECGGEYRCGPPGAQTTFYIRGTETATKPFPSYTHSELTGIPTAATSATPQITSAARPTNAAPGGAGIDVVLGAVPLALAAYGLLGRR